jgi:hypothetical protein
MNDFDPEDNQLANPQEDATHDSDQHQDQRLNRESDTLVSDPRHRCILSAVVALKL